MSEDKDLNVPTIELLEEFMQHMESGGRKIRTLAVIASVVGAYFPSTTSSNLSSFPMGWG